MISFKTNQKGMISITTTVVLTIVITIIVLSFAQIIRREQRQALDNQLNDQAFYAAESGINQARKYIADTWLSRGEIPPNKANCNPDNVNYPEAALPTKLSEGVSFSCLLVNGSPDSLKYDLAPTGPSKVFQLNADQTTIRSIDIAWTPSTSDAPRTNCSTATLQLPTATNWTCRGYGMLRIDLVPVIDANGGSMIGRSSFMGNMFTAFVSPTGNSTGSAVTYTGTGQNINGGTANQGARPTATCSDTGCSITISGLNHRSYYARISTVYRPTTITVTPKDEFNNSVGLIGAQVMLDATGRAQDVLRRVQVRIPLEYDGFHPDYAIQSNESMCKAFSTYNSGGEVYDNSTPGCL